MSNDIVGLTILVLSLIGILILFLSFVLETIKTRKQDINDNNKNTSKPKGVF